MDDATGLVDRIRELTGWRSVRPPTIVTDTTDCMRIVRGDVMRLEGRQYVIQGNRYETRFGISDQPKYWVFGAIDLDTGERKILKTVFHEEFQVHIGVFKVRCYRSPEKEAQVLKMVEGDPRFMQGFSTVDEMGNNVRVIERIRGKPFFAHIAELDKSHEEYFHSDLPDLLWRLVDSLEAIKLLHDRGTCHGDIRNDHIFIEAETGMYRWIDFDLNQHVSDFDVWSMGNILSYAIGKGINSFQKVLLSDQFSDKVKKSLVYEDGSAFYTYRVMNLSKLYPYITKRMNDLLLHFTVKPRASYATIDELLDDYHEMLQADCGRPSGPDRAGVGPVTGE